MWLLSFAQHRVRSAYQSVGKELEALLRILPHSCGHSTQVLWNAKLCQSLATTPSALHRKRLAHPRNSSLLFECSTSLRPPVCGMGSPVVFLLSLRGGNTLSKTTNQRRSKDNAERKTKTISGHSEVVSLTRGSC